MAGDCPALTPQDPLVRGLLGVVDCNVQTMAHGGYSALFAPSAAFAGVLTAALVIYIALIGYRLMLGRSAMGVGDFALTAVKLGAVLALATQWATYQSVVYDTLFHGPEQLATSVLDGMQPQGSQFRGNVFVGLQRAFDDLSAGAASFANPTPQLGASSSGSTALAAAAAASTPTAGQQVSGLLSANSFGALMLVATAALLLISTLGVLLAAKIVLGVLLGVGPVFIALLLFDATRGLFEGWLRATLGFALAPLMATLLTGVALTLLEPSLVEMEALRAQGIFMLEPVYTVTLLVLVIAGVSVGMLVATGVVAAGFRLPTRRTPAVQGSAGATVRRDSEDAAALPRAARVAAATSALDRRDATIFSAAASREAVAAAAGDRRTVVVSSASASRPASADVPFETRLGQGARRSASPRTPRAGARTA